MKYDVKKVSRETLEEVCRILLNNIGYGEEPDLVTFDVSEHGDICVRELKREAEVKPRTRAEVDADIVKCVRAAHLQHGNPYGTHAAYRSPLLGYGSTLVLDLDKLLSEETRP